VFPINRGVLAIQATSAPSERVFSSSGRVMTDERTSLSPQTMSNLLYAKQNLKRVERDKWRFKEDMVSPPSSYNRLPDPDKNEMPRPVSPELQRTSTVMSTARKDLTTSFAETTVDDAQEVEMSDDENEPEPSTSKKKRFE